METKDIKGDINNNATIENDNTIIKEVEAEESKHKTSTFIKEAKDNLHTIIAYIITFVLTIRTNLTSIDGALLVYAMSGDSTGSPSIFVLLLAIIIPFVSLFISHLLTIVILNIIMLFPSKKNRYNMKFYIKLIFYNVLIIHGIALIIALLFP